MYHWWHDVRAHVPFALSVNNAGLSNSFASVFMSRLLLAALVVVAANVACAAAFPRLQRRLRTPQSPVFRNSAAWCSCGATAGVATLSTAATVSAAVVRARTRVCRLLLAADAGVGPRLVGISVGIVAFLYTLVKVVLNNNIVPFLSPPWMGWSLGILFHNVAFYVCLKVYTAVFTLLFVPSPDDGDVRGVVTLSAVAPTVAVEMFIALTMFYGLFNHFIARLGWLICMILGLVITAGFVFERPTRRMMARARGAAVKRDTSSSSSSSSDNGGGGVVLADMEME
jgi:hypothetical protein